MYYTRFHGIESVVSCPVFNLANNQRFLGFLNLKKDAAKNSILTCRIEHPLNVN